MNNKIKSFVQILIVVILLVFLSYIIQNNIELIKDIIGNGFVGIKPLWAIFLFITGNNYHLIFNFFNPTHNFAFLIRFSASFLNKISNLFA